MDLSFDSGSTTRYQKCPDRKARHVYMQRYILDRGDAYAVAFIEANRHDDEPELYFTCVLGAWDDDTNNSDHVTFSCRYGSVVGRKEYACTSVDVPDSFDADLCGVRLSRNQALKHKRVNEFWAVVDFLLEYDASIHDLLHHPLKNSVKTILRLY